MSMEQPKPKLFQRSPFQASPCSTWSNLLQIVKYSTPWGNLPKFCADKPNAIDGQILTFHSPSMSLSGFPPRWTGGSESTWAELQQPQKKKKEKKKKRGLSNRTPSLYLCWRRRGLSRWRLMLLSTRSYLQRGWRSREKSAVRVWQTGGIRSQRKRLKFDFDKSFGTRFCAGILR